MRIKLIGREGGLVGYLEIIPFQIPPEALGWGTRLFVLDPPEKQTEAGTGITIYREGLAYIIPPGAQPKPKPVF